MLFKGTVIHENAKHFAIVWAKYEDLRNEVSRTAYLTLCKPYFPDLPIILASEDGEDHLIYFGDANLIKWLESQKALIIKWKEYGI